MLNEGTFFGMLDASWIGEPVISPWLDSAAMTFESPKQELTARLSQPRGDGAAYIFKHKGRCLSDFFGKCLSLLVPLGISQILIGNGTKYKGNISLLGFVKIRFSD